MKREPDRNSSNRWLEPVADGLTVRLCGAHGSPYTNKVLAYLKYRRCPYRWVSMGSPEEQGTAAPPVPPAAQHLLPKIVWPDGSATNDSSVVVAALRQMWLRKRMHRRTGEVSTGCFTSS